MNSSPLHNLQNYKHIPKVVRFQKLFPYWTLELRNIIINHHVMYRVCRIDYFFIYSFILLFTVNKYYNIDETEG